MRSLCSANMRSVTNTFMSRTVREPSVNVSAQPGEFLRSTAIPLAYVLTRHTLRLPLDRCCPSLLPAHRRITPRERQARPKGRLARISAAHHTSTIRDISRGSRQRVLEKKSKEHLLGSVDCEYCELP